jgi:hypothetical protein
MQFLTTPNNGTSAAERMRIDNAGNVGIGTNNPGFNLHIVGDSTTVELLSTAAAAGAPIFAFRRSRGTHALPTTDSVGDTVGEIDFNSYNDAFRSSAQIIVQTDTGYGATGADSPGRLLFLTTPDGSATAVERMRIDSAGNVLHGASSYINFGSTSGTGGYGIFDNGGTLQYKNSGGSWTNLSGSSQWTTTGSNIYYTTGSVGIGTASPDTLLHVNSNIEVPDGAGFTGNVYFSGGWKYSANGYGTAMYGASGKNYFSVFANNAAGGHGAAATEIKAITIDQSNGNVGIGTTGPAYPLDVNGYVATRGATGGFMAVDSANSNYTILYRNTNKTYLWDNTGNQRITLDNTTGNVGIGTITPASPLHIAGTYNSVSSVANAISAFTTETAAANGDFLRGLSISMTPAKSTYTGLTVDGARIAVGTATGSGTISDLAVLRLAESTEGTKNVGLLIGSSPASGNWSIYNGSANNVYLGTGNVGIGVSAPDHILQPMITNNTVGNYYPLNLRLDRTSTSSSNRGVGLSFSESASGVAQDTMAGIVGIRENSNSTWYGALAFLTYGTNSSNSSSEAGLTEAMRIDHAGNVGIGTVSPGYKLDVAGQVNAASSSGSGGYISTGNYGGTGTAAYFPSGLWANGSNSWIYGNISTNGALADTNSKWAINPSSTVFFNTGGNFGIGTAAPTNPLTVFGNSATLATAWASNSNASGISIMGYNGGTAAYGLLGAGSYAGIFMNGNVGIGTAGPVAKLDVTGGKLRIRGAGTGWFNVSDTADAGNFGTFLRSDGSTALGYIGGGAGAAIGGGAVSDLVLRAEGNLLLAAGGNSERMRIDTSGNVGIGITPSYRLHVLATSGTVAIYGSTNNESGGAVEGHNSYANAWGALGYAAYGVYCSGTLCGGNQAWTNTSDARLKTAIHDLPSDKGLDTILKLRPVTFHWKDNKQDVKLGERLGFIAQEVEIVLPQLVTNGGMDTTIEFADGRRETIKATKSLSYAEFVVPLVKAVQELKHMMDGVISDVKKLAARADEAFAKLAAHDDRLKKLEDENKAMRDALCKLDGSATFCHPAIPRKTSLLLNGRRVHSAVNSSFQQSGVLLAQRLRQQHKRMLGCSG